MSYYDHSKFVHPVPGGSIIPKDTQVYCVESAPHRVETFFTTLGDLVAPSSSAKTYYLTYDITAPELPEEINSVIYNVRALGAVLPVAVYQGSRIWSAFSGNGERTSLYTPEIEYFDTAPPKEEAGDDDE